MTTAEKASPGPKGSRKVFNGRSLLALDAAQHVLAKGPLAYGQDGRFWTYEGGVWSPGKEEVHGRVVELLGNEYRRGHEADILGVVQALVPRMECAAVERFINFKNCLLDWRTGEVHDHDPKVLSTVQMGCNWNPDAECPDFQEFMGQVLNEDDHGRFWETTGYLMMSGNPLHKAVLLHGSGRNGKGVAQGVWQALLGGEQNVSALRLHTLAGNRFASAQLLGKLANICGDIDSTYIESTGHFKEITGGDTLFAENKGESGFSFKPWATLVFSANQLPGSADASTGWSDRWEVIPFPNYFGDQKDVTLGPRLQAEASLEGIAVRAVKALQMLMERGSFLSSESARSSLEQMRMASNATLSWFADRTEADDDGKVRGTNAYRDYELWTKDENRKVMSRTRFYELFEQGRPGMKVTATGGQKTYHGFRVLPRVEPDWIVRDHPHTQTA